MRSALFIFCLAFLLACGQTDVIVEEIPNPTNADLVGQWQLIETLADPGNGSGTFRPVTSSRVIEFLGDATVTSNEALCNPFATNNDSSTGIYSAEDRTITPDACSNIPLSFELNTANELIVYFVCIEACAHKYRKVN